MPAAGNQAAVDALARGVGIHELLGARQHAEVNALFANNNGKVGVFALGGVLVLDGETRICRQRRLSRACTPSTATADGPAQLIPSRPGVIDPPL